MAKYVLRLFLERGKQMIKQGNVRRVVPSLLVYSASAAFAYGRSSSVTGEPETMSFLAWIVLGLIAGFIGSKIINRRGEGIVRDILLGVVGALAGGLLFHLFGASGVSGLNLYSLMVAVIGSVVLLMIYHALRGGRA